MKTAAATVGLCTFGLTTSLLIGEVLRHTDDHDEKDAYVEQAYNREAVLRTLHREAGIPDHSTTTPDNPRIFELHLKQVHCTRRELLRQIQLAGSEAYSRHNAIVYSESELRTLSGDDLRLAQERNSVALASQQEGILLYMCETQIRMHSSKPPSGPIRLRHRPR